jgi:HD-like signal output (HDOD) protein
MPTLTNKRDAVLRDLPALSPMAMKLIGKLARADVDFSEVERMIEKDTVLCAALLRTVNSARFSRGTEISRVREAVVRLGASKLRRMALGLTVSKLFGRSKVSAPWSQLRFNLHSAAVGVMTEILSSKAAVEFSPAAFVAGLLHDVGKFAIAINLPDEYRQVIELWQQRGSPLSSIDECEMEVLGFDHAEVSGVMLARWEMADYVYRAVAMHHHPTDGESAVSLSRALNLADRFVNSLGMMTEPAPAELGDSCALELPGAVLDHDEITAQFAVEYEEFREFLL